MAGYNEHFFEGNCNQPCSLSSWLVTITLKEVFTLFMAGYNSPQRSEESEHFF